jgi:hypothetical protein
MQFAAAGNRSDERIGVLKTRRYHDTREASLDA